MPVLEDGDPVGEGQRLALIVGDVHPGRSGLAVHAPQLDLHFQADLEVKGAQRLVEQQDLRALHQRPRERDPLHLAAGELTRPPPLVAGHPNQVQRPLDPLLDLVGCHPVDAQTEGDVLEHVEMREQRRALEDHVHRPAVRVDMGHLLPADGDRPLRRLDEAGDHPQQSGLSAPRWTEEGDELAGGDLEVDAAQHLVATERVAHPANGQSAIAYLLAHRPTPISPARRSLRAARRVATAATTQSNIVIASSRVEATLIPGSTVRRRRPKM